MIIILDEKETYNLKFITLVDFNSTNPNFVQT